MPRIPTYESGASLPSSIGAYHDNSAGEAIANAGASFGQSLMQFAQQKEEREQKTAILAAKNEFRQRSLEDYTKIQQERQGQAALPDENTGYKGVYKTYNEEALKWSDELLTKHGVNKRYRDAAMEQLDGVANAYRDNYAAWESTQSQVWRKETLQGTQDVTEKQLSADLQAGGGLDDIAASIASMDEQIDFLVGPTGNAEGVKNAKRVAAAQITKTALATLVKSDPVRAAEILKQDTTKAEKRKPLFVAGENTKGLVVEGNIDLANRPVHKNADGSISTVRSISLTVDGSKAVVIPTVSPDGDILSNEDAVDLYRKTKQHLGVFESEDAANSYAQTLHEQQAEMYVGQTTIALSDILDPLDRAALIALAEKERVPFEADREVDRIEATATTPGSQLELAQQIEDDDVRDATISALTHKHAVQDKIDNENQFNTLEKYYSRIFVNKENVSLSSIDKDPTLEPSQKLTVKSWIKSLVSASGGDGQGEDGPNGKVMKLNQWYAAYQKVLSGDWTEIDLMRAANQGVLDPSSAKSLMGEVKKVREVPSLGKAVETLKGELKTVFKKDEDAAQYMKTLYQDVLDFRTVHKRNPSYNEIVKIGRELSQPDVEKAMFDVGSFDLDEYTKGEQAVIKTTPQADKERYKREKRQTYTQREVSKIRKAGQWPQAVWDEEQNVFYLGKKDGYHYYQSVDGHTMREKAK